MKKPFVESLWKEKYPVRNVFHLISITLFITHHKENAVIRTPERREDGVDYDDPFTLQSKIEDDWWLTHPSFKYLLCCLVRKDCKDINTKPCEQPPSRTRLEAREAKLKAIVTEHAIAKSERPVEKYGDVDHQLKKVRLNGMQAHAEKIIVDTLNTQIKNLKENVDVYKSVHGENAYNELLVSLISKMTGTMNKKGTTPSSASALAENDEDK